MLTPPCVLSVFPSLVENTVVKQNIMHTYYVGTYTPAIISYIIHNISYKNVIFNLLNSENNNNNNNIESYPNIKGVYDELHNVGVTQYIGTYIT